jgi:spermidine/putrescine transport system permease protein
VSLYQTQFLRSLQYAGVATAIALVISYPLAYWIAFRGGQWKNLLLLLVIAPFFVTYLIRTLAWQTILSDNGIVVSTLQHLHILAPDGRLLATSVAVIAGTTYNFLPFMVLPLYVSLEAGRPEADRGRRRSLREPRCFVPPRDPAAFAARRLCGRAADVHPRLR